MRWQESQIPQLEDRLSRTPPDTIAHQLTRAQLAIAREERNSARNLLSSVTRHFVVQQEHAIDIRVNILQSHLALEDFDRATDLVREVHGIECSFGAMPPEHDVPHAIAAVLWEFHDPWRCSVLFNPRLFESDSVETLKRHAAWLDLVARFMRSDHFIAGRVYADAGDVGGTEGITACDFRDGSFPVPDPLFCQSRGRAETRKLLAEQSPVWEDRIPKVFWRGSCTGVMTGGWRTLPRIRLCEIARDAPRPDLFDVAVARYHPGMDEAARADIRASRVFRDPVPKAEFGRYKYQIEMPGNGHSISWEGLHQKLCTASPVLKIPSPLGHTQWYFDRLTPWFNYVPVLADMSDLVAKAEWLSAHDEQARDIGRRGRDLVDSLDYERELLRATATVNAAIRHHSCRFGD